jgi:quercetin dioxygenase-like cupin family protein
MDETERARATAAMFLGEVYRQPLTDPAVDQLSVAVVHFVDGGRNTFHTHPSEQVLVITDGEGIVATESEERAVCAGDVAIIPAGESHWHGARPGKSLTHLAISIRA